MTTSIFRKKKHLYMTFFQFIWICHVALRVSLTIVSRCYLHDELNYVFKGIMPHEDAFKLSFMDHVCIAFKMTNAKYTLSHSNSAWKKREIFNEVLRFLQVITRSANCKKIAEHHFTSDENNSSVFESL